MNEIEYLRKLSGLSPEDLAAEVLNADQAEAKVLRIHLGAQQYERIQTMATLAATRGAQSSPKRGNVVVLNGIMGSLLSEYGAASPSQIWIQVLNLISGKFDRLGLDAKGKSINDVRASGLYLRYYGSLMVSLSRTWNVRPFFFDWRRDIRLAAADLRTMLDSQFPGEPVHLVAHSMGGLVARSFIAQFPDRWNVADAAGTRGNLIMLGTPNYGSFAIPRLLLGTNDILSLVAKIDIHHNVPDLVAIAKSFSGVYQMMPMRGHIEGLDPLYRASTYTLSAIDQAMLDDALAFQTQIAGVTGPERMVYVAGYNRLTPAAIQDVTQLANDRGYILSRKGDGTVPHDLGLIPGVPTFYVDEEHAKLPANSNVQAAMDDLLATCSQPDEKYLWKGLGSQFLNDRGIGEDQQILQAEQAARRATKESQVAVLKSAILSRGSLDSTAVSVEQQALADSILEYDPLRLSLAGKEVSFDPEPAADVSSTNKSEDPEKTVPLSPPKTIRVHVIAKDIGEVELNDTGDPLPIDAIAVGHYLRVRPTGAEHALDKSLSPILYPGQKDELLLTMFHERGVLRGDLGAPFLLPDPRPNHAGNLIVIAGMGPTGEFGIPELSLLARETCWTVAQLGKRHLATTPIGASSGNLSYTDSIHGWLGGLARAISSAAQGKSASIDAITFVVQDKDKQQEKVVNALKREAASLSAAALQIMNLDLSALPPSTESDKADTIKTASTRISIDFDPSGVYRYSALTDNASIPERVLKLDPRRIQEVSARLLVATDPNERFRLGKFLLEFLFPRDLRAQLTGGLPVVLQLNNEAAKVCWEIAAQPLSDDDPISAEEFPYLGLQRGLTRQLRTVLAPPPEPPPPVGRLLRVLIVADGVKEMPLPGAAREAQSLTQLFDRVNAANQASGSLNRIEYRKLVGPSKATTLDVLLHLADQPPFDILHYAGHCTYDELKPERSGFLFSGDDRLTASDLDRIDRTPKFVFANACESGVLPSRPDLSSPGLPAAFAEAFFQKGVANFIGTAWPVNDEPASLFAVSLYRNLLGDGTPPVPMFEAVRRARQKIADTTTWGAYQHYGDPHFRVFR